MEGFPNDYQRVSIKMGCLTWFSILKLGFIYSQVVCWKIETNMYHQDPTRSVLLFFPSPCWLNIRRAGRPLPLFHFRNLGGRENMGITGAENGLFWPFQWENDQSQQWDGSWGSLFSGKQLNVCGLNHLKSTCCSGWSHVWRGVTSSYHWSSFCWPIWPWNKSLAMG